MSRWIVEDLFNRKGILFMLLNKHAYNEHELNKALRETGLNMYQFIKAKELVFKYGELVEELMYIIPDCMRHYNSSNLRVMGGLKVYESGNFQIEDLPWQIKLRYIESNPERTRSGVQIYVNLNGTQSVFVRFVYQDGRYYWLLDKFAFKAIVLNRIAKAGK